MRKWKVWHILLTVFLILLSILGIYKTNGLVGRDKYAKDIDQHNYKLSTILGHHINQNGKAVMNWGNASLNNTTNENMIAVLLGDSHAAHYTYGITSAKSTPHIMLIWSGGCLNLPDIISKPLEKWQDDKWFENCKNNRINSDNLNGKPLILSQAWSQYSIDKIQCKFGQCLDQTTNFYDLLERQLRILIDSYPNSPIVIIGQVPAPENTQTQCYINQQTNCLIEYTQIKKGIIEINSFLKEFSQKNNIYYIDPTYALCNKGSCRYSIDGHSLYLDDNHLSALGSIYVWKYIEAELINKKIF